jgi:hypothetical protein
MFGSPAPDGGWAMRIIRASDLPDEDPDLKLVLAALMVARAAALGRGPIKEDLDVALVLCGYGFEAKPEVIQRRHRWLKAVHHDVRPGESAVAEVDVDMIVNKPEQVRWALSHSSEPTPHSGEQRAGH